MVDHESGRPNAVYSGLCREVYPVVPDIIEMSHLQEERWYGGALDGEQ